MPKLFVDGRGDINFENNGYHSDFFWQLNSNFLLQNIVYKHFSEKEKEFFKQYGVDSIPDGVYSNKGDSRKYNKPKLNYSVRHRKESRVVQNILNSFFKFYLYSPNLSLSHIFLQKYLYSSYE